MHTRAMAVEIPIQQTLCAEPDGLRIARHFWSWHDVALMDPQTPEIDDVEATRRIVARWPVDERPRVAMTANAMQRDRGARLVAGMDGHMIKVVRVGALGETLQDEPAQVSADS